MSNFKIPDDVFSEELLGEIRLMPNRYDDF